MTVEHDQAHYLNKVTETNALIRSKLATVKKLEENVSEKREGCEEREGGDY
jgi:hypothetical protein